MKIRTDRYGNTRIHTRDDVAHVTPETKVADALAKHGIANRVYTQRVMDLLMAHGNALTREQAVAYVVAKSRA